MTTRRVVSHSELRRLFEYLPDTGEFVRLVGRSGRGGKMGAKAGNLRPDGYLQISINQRLHLSHAQNQANCGSYRNNKSGIKGVYRQHGKWVASIKRNGKSKYLGMFGSPEAAHAAYMKAATDHFQEFARAA